MSDSEEEFASADEGQGDPDKRGVGSGKVTEVGKTAGGAGSKQSEGVPVKKNPSGGDSASKESSKENTKTPSGSAKPEEKPVAKAKSKNKNSKQKRKQGSKKEAGASSSANTASASVTAKAETKSDSGVPVGDKAEEDQSAPSDSQTPEPSSSITGETSDDHILISTATSEPTDQTGTAESSDPVKTAVSAEKKIEEPSKTVPVEEQTIDRGGSGSQDGVPEDKDLPAQPAHDTEQEKTSSGWGGWSSWGSSLVSAATSSVSTFTNQVGEGFTTVLETVETTLGAPLPEELAKSDEETTGELEEQRQTSQESQEQGNTAEREESGADKASTPTEDGGKSGSEVGGGWLSGWGVSNITHLVSDKGKTLVTGGLDVLESIGKKTYDALSEHDPGLKAVMKGENKPNLSSMLREAKEQADERSRQEEEYEESRQAHFGAMFDEYQGLVNLEALEMLSNQSETKVQSLLAGSQSDEREQLKRDLVKIKEAFELEELEDDDDDIEHDFSKLITDHLSEFHRGTSPAKLNAVQAKIRGWLSNFYNETEGTTADPKEIHKVCIQSLAELTAKTVEQYHKAGELLLLQTDGGKDMLSRATALASVTRVVCTEVGILSTKFTKCLNKVSEDLENTDSINTYITNVYLEASNSSTYIQDAFQLLLPVLQQASVQAPS